MSEHSRIHIRDCDTAICIEEVKPRGGGENLVFFLFEALGGVQMFLIYFIFLIDAIVYKSRI